MIRSAGSRQGLLRAILLSAAIAAGAVSAPLAASAAHAAPAVSEPRSMDAEAEATVYVGVRQAAVGDSVPVTVVGGAEGSVWEISTASPAAVLGTMTIGADGTGTTLVALPVGTSPGSVAIVARSGDAETSTVLSSAGGADAPAPAPGAEAPSAPADAGPPVGVLLIGGAGVALAAIAAVFAVRRVRAPAH